MYIEVHPSLSLQMTIVDRAGRLVPEKVTFTVSPAFNVAAAAPAAR